MKKFILFLLFAISLFANDLVDYYTVYKKDFFVDEGRFGIRVAMDKKNKTRTTSESQGYGMLITAFMARYDKSLKTIFDRLYIYSRVHPSPNCKNFMTWQTPAKRGDSDSAFDGDADMAYALLVADRVWGSSKNINYKKEAVSIINSLMSKVIGKESYLPLLGDWVKQNGKKYNQYTTRSSDFMLGHFKAFYRVTGDRRWLKVVKATQKAMIDILKEKENTIKLIPDFLYYDKKVGRFFPTKRHFLEEEDNSYYYNACRVPFRVGVDALINHDSLSKKIVRLMTLSVAKKANYRVSNIKSGYELNGKSLGNYLSPAFIAPFGVGAMLDSGLLNFQKQIYNYIRKRHINYYEDSLSLLSMLVINGVYFDPTN